MSEIKVDTVAEKTSANGVTVDGLNIKDSKLVTANSVVTSNITDANITTAKIADVNVTEGKIADNAITLAKMASGTDGNIISYDASGNPVAVATGNDGQVLTSTGAGSPPAFETPGGGDYVKLVSATVSGSPSSVSINGFFSSTYDIYVLKIYNFRQSSQTTPFYRINVGGSPNTETSPYYTVTGNWYGQSGTSNQTNDKYFANEDKARLFNWDISNNANEVSAWEHIIYNPLEGDNYNLIETRGVVNAQNNTTLSVFHAMTEFRKQAAISGLTLYAGASSNISELKYSLYGLKK